MVIQDGEPETRYTQSVRVDGGNYTVETGMCVPNGALNLRIGKGAAAANEPNSQDAAVTSVQKLNPAETIQVLMSWASGAGLPAGYAGAIYSYT